MRSLGLGEILRIAFRNISRNRRRSLIAGATVAIGVAAILFSRAYINGLQTLILDFVIEDRHGAMQVEREGYAASQDLGPLDLDIGTDAELEARLRKVPGVTEIAPRLRFVGFLSSGDNSTMFTASAVDPEREARVCPRGPAKTPPPEMKRADFISGRSFASPDEEGIILAVDLAKSMKAKLGQTVTLLVQTRGGSMDAIDLTVVGVFRFGDPMEDKHNVVVPLKAAQRVLHMQGRATSYGISVESQEIIPAVETRMREAIRGVQPAMELQTWKQLSPYYADVIKLQNDVLGVVVAIVFVLVVAGIVNTMLMSVFERTREIGTLMAIGFRRKRIMVLFLLESLMLTTIASVVGSVVGMALVQYAHNHGIVFYVPAVGEVLNHPNLAPTYAVFACVGASLGGIVGGILPAYRASRLRPIEALRST